jgi:hypothetical protein
MIKEIFLVDSNTFIVPHRQYYPFDLMPSFWEFLKNNITSGDIIILDSVYDEILKGNDALSNWLKSLPNFQPFSRRQEPILKNYAQVLQYIQTSGIYTENALAEWAIESVADPWLIAAAKEYGWTIITFEDKLNFTQNAKHSRLKIPNICEVFGVKYGNLFYMMRQLGFNHKGDGTDV